MTVSEIPVSFQCEGERLFGILHAPEQAISRGVLIVVGGPQYRVGSHRQFLRLARDMAMRHIPVMRFDYRGIGDSAAASRTFESINEDIQSAANAFFAHVSTLENIVIWGLCDGASAASFYGCRDKRVSGLVLVNPWVRTESGIAKAYLKHYYVSRLFDLNLWRKIFNKEFLVVDSVKSFLAVLKATVLRSKALDRMQNRISWDSGELNDIPLPDRMLMCLQGFTGPILFILSGNDLTASEFKDVVNSSPGWRRLMKKSCVTQLELQEANHTFSRLLWRDQVTRWTADWLQSW